MLARCKNAWVLIQATTSASLPSTPKRQMLLPIQRVNNVGVFLNRLKLSPGKVVAAIMACCSNGVCVAPVPEGENYVRPLTELELNGLLGCMPSEVC